jgi:prepilin-type N-terminal cleavage/methylation domain-containing protein
VNRAFTLVEMLVVVAILGIVGVTSLAYIGGRDDLKAASAARRLVSTIQYAQNLAIAKAEPHYVVPNLAVSGNSLDVATHDGTGWVLVDHPTDSGHLGMDFSRLDGVRRADTKFGTQPVLGFDLTGAPFTTSLAASPRNHIATPVDVHVASGTFDYRIRVEPVTGELLIELTGG